MNIPNKSAYPKSLSMNNVTSPVSEFFAFLHAFCDCDLQGQGHDLN